MGERGRERISPVSLCSLLIVGSTAEKIVIVGDSAGGNLLLATMLRAIEDGIRLPDGIVPIYTPTYIQFIPSPSRSLSVMDALLPVGVLTTCLEGKLQSSSSRYLLSHYPYDMLKCYEPRPVHYNLHMHASRACEAWWGVAMQ